LTDKALHRIGRVVILGGMAKKPTKRTSDVNQLAKAIVEAATAEGEPVPIPETPDGKNAAAVALGRLGGIKGGPARKKALSKQRRSEIARQAARSRWEQ
jgi:hypothetical protein